MSRRAPTYAKRIDANQPEILSQLQQIPGLTIYIIGRPLDALVGYRNRTWLLEIKNPETGHGLTQDQRKFLSWWTGGYLIGHTFEEIWEQIREQTTDDRRRRERAEAEGTKT